MSPPTRHTGQVRRRNILWYENLDALNVLGSNGKKSFAYSFSFSFLKFEALATLSLLPNAIATRQQPCILQRPQSPLQLCRSSRIRNEGNLCLEALELFEYTSCLVGQLDQAQSAKTCYSRATRTREHSYDVLPQVRAAWGHALYQRRLWYNAQHPQQLRSRNPYRLGHQCRLRLRQAESYGHTLW